jgi:hypothetical protein
LFSLLVSSVASGSPVRMPNLAPHHLVFLQPPAEGPATVPRGKLQLGVDLAYATVFSSGRSGAARSLFDLEVARAGLLFAFGLGPGTEFGLEAPILWMGDGAFDKFLIDYHRIFNLPSGDREDAPRNRFAYFVTDGGDTYSPNGDGKAGFGDFVLRLKHRLAGGADARFALAGRALLKLPTGRARYGFGSGGTDGGLGLVLRGRSGRFAFYGNLDGLYLSQSPDSALDLGSRWALSAIGAVTAPVWDWGELAFQLRYFSTPYSTGIGSVDKDVWMLAVAFRRPFLDGRAVWSIGFTEDLAVEASPDFAVLASFQWVSARGRPD